VRTGEKIHQRSKPDCYRWDGDTLILELRLQPRASDNALLGIVDGRVRMHVTAAPVDNAANQRMVAILAKAFGVAKSRVRLLAGASNRDKRVAIEGPRRTPGGTEEATWRLIFAERASP
jgi:uncharacterized protein